MGLILTHVYQNYAERRLNYILKKLKTLEVRVDRTGSNVAYGSMYL
jgi:hypothetical protein